MIYFFPSLWTATWDGKLTTSLYVRRQREAEWWGHAGAAPFPFTFLVVEYRRIERLCAGVYVSRSDWFKVGDLADRWKFSKLKVFEAVTAAPTLGHNHEPQRQEGIHS